MKYVILQHNHKERDLIRVFPVIFSEQLTHSVVAEALIHAQFREEGHDLTVKASGFVHNPIFRGIESGSQSLKNKGTDAKHVADETLLNMPNYMQGILL